MPEIIKLSPISDSWFCTLNGTEHEIKARKALFYLKKSFQQTYPVNLYGTKGFKAGLVDILNEKMGGFAFRFDIPNIEYNESALDNLELRGYQKTAIESILNYGFGIISCPTAAGKTRMELGLIKFFPKPLLLLVPSRSLLHQFKSELDNFEIRAGMYGDGMKELGSDITLMTNQSLLKLAKNADGKNYLKTVKSIIMDEVHHSSKGCYAVLGRMKALYRSGFSATPWHTLDPLMKARIVANFGGIRYDGKDDAEVAQFRNKPTVYVMRRNEEVQDENANEIMEAISNHDYVNQRRFIIVQDKNRNGYILKLAELARSRGLNVFIVVGWKEHIEYIRNIASNITKNIEFITGDDSSSSRTAIYKSIGNGEAKIICGTVGNEGVDIPNLNLVILGDIGKSEIQVIQSIGRAARQAEGKNIAAVIDIYDSLFSHHYSRRKKVYDTENYQVFGSKEFLELIKGIGEQIAIG